MATSSNSNKQFALITGASAGIGYELAKEFGRNGFDLLIISAADRIHATAQALQGELGVHVQPVQADLATHEGIHQLISAIQAAGRPLDAAAINAGIGVSGRFLETDLSKELEMIALNVTGTVHLAKYIVKDMVARGSGRILFTASIAGTMPTPYEAVYGATKAFDRSFSQSLREELKDTGVSVTALMPGATETEFFHRAGADNTKLGAGEKDDPAEVAKEGSRHLWQARITSSPEHSRTSWRPPSVTRSPILLSRRLTPKCRNQAPPIKSKRLDEPDRSRVFSGRLFVGFRAGAPSNRHFGADIQ